MDGGAPSDDLNGDDGGGLGTPSPKDGTTPKSLDEHGDNSVSQTTFSRYQVELENRACSHHPSKFAMCYLLCSLLL